MTKVLVTGATGFVGRALSDVLQTSGFDVKEAVRSQAFSQNGAACSVVGNINAETLWQDALQDIDVVVHLAARVHIMEETSLDAFKAFREVNAIGTEHLARQCAVQGVKRFIYLSTIKVHGESSITPLCADDAVAPQDFYAQSKWEAEQALSRLGAETGLEVVIIRPPLVYGPGVKGNFLRLMRWVDSGIPMPLARVDNARSMIGLGNLCDIIKTCIDHPHAQSETFLVADNHDLSIFQLITLIAQAMNRPARCLAVPVSWLYRLGALFGKSAEIERLCGSLQINCQKTTEILGWSPPFSVEGEIKKTVAWFMAHPH